MGHLDPAKLALILVTQHAPVQIHNRVRMSAGRAAQQKLAGHTEVHHQAMPGIQLDHDKLAAPADRADTPAGQRRAHLVRIAAQDARATEFGGDDAPPGNTGDRPDYSFDLGKLRHGPALRA